MNFHKKPRIKATRPPDTPGTLSARAMQNRETF